MRLRVCLYLMLISLFLVTPSGVGEALPTEWQVVAPGIEYREFTLPTPNNVFVARMDRGNPNVILESSIAQGRLASGKEAVSDMASRYNQALNFWGHSYITPTWGTRNQVVVAINGSYYDIPTGEPQNGQIHSGWYAKRFDDLGGWSGLAWKLSRDVFIGECANHFPEKQFVTYTVTGNTQLINAVNDSRDQDELVVYTPQYDSHTHTDDEGVEVLVEMTRPTMVLPAPNYARGYVREIRVGQGSTKIPFDHVVLSASGTATETLVANVSLGAEIGISQEITHYQSDCETPLALDWTKTYASVGGAFYFLKDGVVQSFSDPGATERHPRTAIAYNDDYVFFIVVDGRDTENSLGMTIQELGVFASDSDTLGALWAVAQDGGGSSTMVVDGVVVNNTYCNNVYCIYDYKTYLPFVEDPGREVPDGVAGEESVETQPIVSATFERLVANGMMMVVVEPVARSNTFVPGEVVTTTSETVVYLGPGTNYANIATVPPGTQGVILDHLRDLEGVLAKGVYWWKVSFGGTVGWVKEAAIKPPPLLPWYSVLGRFSAASGDLLPGLVDWLRWSGNQEAP